MFALFAETEGRRGAAISLEYKTEIMIFMGKILKL
jgi:hypothetical protein